MKVILSNGRVIRFRFMYEPGLSPQLEERPMTTCIVMENDQELVKAHVMPYHLEPKVDKKIGRKYAFTKAMQMLFPTVPAVKPQPTDDAETLEDISVINANNVEMRQLREDCWNVFKSKIELP